MSADLLFPCTAEENQAVTDAMRRWLERAVIGLNLCPFAKAVHVKRQIRYAVTAAGTADELLLELERELQWLVDHDADELDTTLLMLPHVFADFLDFHFFQAEADALLRRMQLQGVVQIASFHPQFEFAGTASDAMENFSNHAPVATLHLLREASIDRAVAAIPDAASIYERNIETLEQLGEQGWQDLWRD